MNILLFTYTTDPTTGGWGRYAYDLKRALEEEGHRVSALSDLVSVPLRNPAQYLFKPHQFFFHEYWQVRRALRNGSWDLVHVVVEPYLLFLPLLPHCPAPCVVTIHGTYAYPPLHVPAWWRPIARTLFLRALRATSQVIAVSEYTKRYFLDTLSTQGIGRTPPVTVIHNGVDADAFPFVSVGASQAKKVILTTAPTKGRKGVIESLRAVAAYRRAYDTPFEYRIVGTHDPESVEGRRAIQEAETLGVADCTAFVGRVSDEALRHEYERADLFLMLPVVKGPYFEGFGLVYLEANACGVPTIASAEGGSAEAVEEGKSGYVVDPRNPEAVAQRMHDILDCGAIARSDARAWATKHDIRRVVRTVLDVYAAARG